MINIAAGKKEKVPAALIIAALLFVLSAVKAASVI